MVTINLGTYKSKKSIDYLDKKIKLEAIRYIALVPMTLHLKNIESNIECDDLKKLCNEIIFRSRLSKEGNNLVMTINLRDENLYKLITFGNMSFHGNSLLKDAILIGKERSV